MRDYAKWVWETITYKTKTVDACEQAVDEVMDDRMQEILKQEKVSVRLMEILRLNCKVAFLQGTLHAGKQHSKVINILACLAWAYIIFKIITIIIYFLTQ